MPPGEHVEHTSRRAHHYVRSLSLEFLYFVTEIGPADAGVACRPHVVAQSEDDLLDLRRRRRETEDDATEPQNRRFTEKVK